MTLGAKTCGQFRLDVSGARLRFRRRVTSEAKVVPLKYSPTAHVCAGTPKEEFSRTVPLVSKVCNTQMARLATRLMLGAKLEDLKLKDKKFNHHGAKEAVFPFDKFPKVDPVLGPEMRSTGEVLGLSDDYALAYYKSQEAAGSFLPNEGAVLISLSDKVNLSEQAIEIGKEL